MVRPMQRCSSIPSGWPGVRWLAGVALTVAAIAATAERATSPEPMPHRVNTTKFTIDDVDGTKPFYEELLGMKELDRFVAPDFLVEPFMGFDQGGRIGLLAFSRNENIEKTRLPVSVVSVPDLAAIVARFEAASYPIERNPAEARAFATDPSGNVIEVVETEGLAKVSGARLIVDDIEASLAFFAQAFGVKAARRERSDNFDEARLEFDAGMFLALYEAKPRAPFPRSDQPVVAIYSKEFDAVLTRVQAVGGRVRTFGEHMFLADDPSGNVVEVVRDRN